MISTFCKLDIDWNFLNLIKNVYKNSIADIILNGEKLESFPLRLRILQECQNIPICRRHDPIP
jgi:hypothetical protein